MADKVTVYLDPERHRRFKVAAANRGISLTEFMARAADQALEGPDREAAARQMDRVRRLFRGNVTPSEIRDMREEGRRP